LDRNLRANGRVRKAQSMALDKYVAREWRMRLSGVFNTIWDPIGGCPADEYDAYVGKVASLVRTGASDEELRQYLCWSEAEHIGLGEPDPSRLDRTLAAIRALGPIS
jgi:hypothetical protein